MERGEEEREERGLEGEKEIRRHTHREREIVRERQRETERGLRQRKGFILKGIAMLKASSTGLLLAICGSNWHCSL